MKCVSNVKSCRDSNKQPALSPWCLRGCQTSSGLARGVFQVVLAVCEGAAVTAGATVLCIRFVSDAPIMSLNIRSQRLNV